MKTTAIEPTVKKLQIGDTDVFLENFEKGKGKITISNTYGHNYSMFWGAMGESLEEFLCGINSDYFASKLIPVSDERIIDTKATFTEVRKFIREEMGMPFYREMEFQKNMRKVLRSFQRECEDEYGGKYRFVDCFFSSFIDRLDYFLIDDRFERNEIEEGFKGICEHWSFLVEKPSANYDWLKSFHGKLKAKLQKL